MTDIPEAMKRNGRPRIPEFDPEEYLYRRVMPEQWDEVEIDIDAIELPDMSVNRASLGPPQWVRLGEERGKDWAVVGFKVKDIPTDILHLGVDIYTFNAKHIQFDNNYPHSEVWGHRNGVHINAKKDLDKALHQRWRERLLWKIKTFLRPYEVCEE